VPRTRPTVATATAATKAIEQESRSSGDEKLFFKNEFLLIF
jgi:hypothetical protein